jgi:hypothetical protein
MDAVQKSDIADGKPVNVEFLVPSMMIRDSDPDFDFDGLMTLTPEF